jgi:sodium-dependent dicarboxylate transporter 2/3/5
MSETDSGRLPRIYWGTAIALGAFAAAKLIPLPDVASSTGEVLSLTSTGRSALGIVFFTAILWALEVFPFPITALVGAVMLPLFGVMEWRDVIRFGVGSDIVPFLLGIMILSTGVVESGLARRVSRRVVRIAGSDPKRAILAFLLFSGLCAAWLGNLAVAAMLQPIAIAIMASNGLVPGDSNFGTALSIGCAWGALIGSIATPAGGASNLVAIGFLRDLAGVNLGFTQWAAVGVPAAMLMMVPAWALLVVAFPPEIAELQAGCEGSVNARKNRGALTAHEIWALLGLVTMLALWSLGDWLKRAWGLDMSMSLGAIAGAVVYLLPTHGIHSWDALEHRINWGNLVLVAVGMSLGAAVYNSGAAAWLANAVFGRMADLAPFPRALLLSGAVMLFKLMFSSNTATASIVMPVVLAAINGVAVGPWEFLAPAALAAPLAFILVTSAPANLVFHDSKCFSVRDMAVVGIPMTIIAAVCIAVVCTMVLG